jgi:imidazolonepropionase
MPRYDRLLIDARLATLSGADDYGLIDDGAIAWRDGVIAFVGARADLPDSPDDLATDVVSVGGALVTPALVDCHTHLVFGGNRAREFDLRLQGASYAEIAQAGGGIVSTVAATRSADDAALLAQSLPRARALLRDGVTTIEIKSGYGLDLDSEARMLRVARRIGTTLGITVRTTFLGAHAVPPEFKGRQGEYVDAVLAMLTPLADLGLVDAVDAFCEGIGFSPDEVRRVFEAARARGIAVKLHADQLSDLGGAALAAEFGALSADHLEWTDEAGVAAMKRAGTVAVLLPGAFYALRETRLPPIDTLRSQGVPMAIATDCNPGTSPLLSLRLAMNMACTLFRLTPCEALLGATRHAAQALGLGQRKGRLVSGMDADVVVWRTDDPAALSYWIAGDLVTRVYVGGLEVHRQLE